MKNHFAAVVIAALLICAAGSARAVNTLGFTALTASTKVDLGQVTFIFHVSPKGTSANVGAQMYLHRATPVDSWEFVNATAEPGGGNAKIFPLYHGLDNTIEFTADLPVGTYDNYRLLLFDASDGQHIDYGHLIYDSSIDSEHRSVKMHFKVLTADARVLAPQIHYAPIPASTEDADGTYTVTIPATIRLPEGFTTSGDGLWAMAKGNGGFSQVWVPMSSAVEAGSKLDPYLEAPAQFVLKGLKPGIWNVQLGVFRSNWGDPLQWVYPGLDFEVGGDAWETKSDRMPPRLRYSDGRFVMLDLSNQAQPASLYPNKPQALQAVKFVRGGNYGNALDWTTQPALDTPGYFSLLGDLGCRFIRLLFNPDRYLAEPMYRHCVDQVVQNIWAAGEYPLIAPQDLPKGDSLQQRIDSGEAVCRTMAGKYKGKSVWLEVCNEPHEFGTWAQWKPVAERYVKTIRGIDPNAFVVVPFENWSKDGRGAASDPITDVRVDLYDGHAYIDPQDVSPRFGSATKAGLPVLIGEYGSTNPTYMGQMDRAMQALSPPPVAIAPWAFTIKGQDSLPLIESANGANLEFTASGKAIAQAFDSWQKGKPIE